MIFVRGPRPRRASQPSTTNPCPEVRTWSPCYLSACLVSQKILLKKNFFSKKSPPSEWHGHSCSMLRRDNVHVTVTLPLFKTLEGTAWIYNHFELHSAFEVMPSRRNILNNIKKMQRRGWKFLILIDECYQNKINVKFQWRARSSGADTQMG